MQTEHAAPPTPESTDGPAAAPPAAPPGNGATTEAVAARPPHPAVGEPPGDRTPPSRRRRRLLWLIPILLVVGAVSVAIAARFWYESTYFIMTDNAQVTGDLIQTGSPVAGRLQEANLEVGQMVQKDQVIATVSVPQQVGAIPLTDLPLLEQTGSSNAQIPVRSPINGVVAARLANVGGTVVAGGAIYALIDPQRIWVDANIDEDKVARVRRGQGVEITSVALGKSFPGQVEAVTPASSATFSLLPAQNLSGNFNKVTQWVPVKIAVRAGDTLLPLGTSVSVRIRVEDGDAPAWTQWLP
jgi:multidrug resistance efflux pump